MRKNKDSLPTINSLDSFFNSIHNKKANSIFQSSSFYNNKKNNNYEIKHTYNFDEDYNDYYSYTNVYSLGKSYQTAIIQPRPFENQKQFKIPSRLEPLASLLPSKPKVKKGVPVKKISIGNTSKRYYQPIRDAELYSEIQELRKRLLKPELDTDYILPYKISNNLITMSQTFKRPETNILVKKIEDNDNDEYFISKFTKSSFL